MAIDKRTLTTHFPKLYHMAATGSWPGIKEHGLLSTTALLDLFEIRGAERKRIEEQNRPESIEIFHRIHGKAIIRDQKPMSDSGLRRAITDSLSPRDWHLTLNAKVFFWVQRHRLDVMINARAYRARPKTVLYLNTAELLDACEDSILLAPMNTGCTKPVPHPRNARTFLPLSEFPFEKRKKINPKDPIVELAVTGGVLDIAKLVTRVEEISAEGEVSVVFQRS